MISVIVVSFNTREKLRRCLECIETRHETVVIDNRSTDGSVEMVRDAFPHVRLIANQINVGFGPANNQGSELASGDLHLYLNSDAYAERGAIDRLAEAFDDSTVVAAGGRLLNPDGTTQQSTANRLTLWAVFCEQTLLEKALPNAKIFSPYWTTVGRSHVGEASRLQKESTKANRTIPESIEEAPWLTPQVMGACLMVRAPQGKPIERFDPRYFLYCEDTDLCLRLNRHGIILYVPAARFTHDLGSSSAKDPALGIIRYNRGKELYFRIHHGPIASIVCLVMDRLGALLRLLLWSIAAALALGRNDRKNRQMRSFWRVLTTSRLSPEASSHILE